MEYVDVLDDNGNTIGQTKAKSEVHRDGDWHKAVHVWIINSKSELLIQKRASIKENHPNIWDIPSAGHVSAGESSMLSAMRETEEELGLKLSEKDFEHLFTATQRAVTNNGTYINTEFSDVFLVKMDLDPVKLKLQKEEVAELKFIPYKNLEKIVSAGDKDFVSHPEEYKKLFEELHKRYP